jgi:hypothetical protein
MIWLHDDVQHIRASVVAHAPVTSVAAFECADEVLLKVSGGLCKEPLSTAASTSTANFRVFALSWHALNSVGASIKASAA